MARYRRKKPIVIEAMQYPGHSVRGVDALIEFEEWLEPIATAIGCWPMVYRGQALIIPGLAGDYEAWPGDWIIQGVAGELAPCKPIIFEMTYEPAEEY